jgi:FAD:protein FMN transferase
MNFYEFQAMSTGIKLGASGDARCAEKGFQKVTAWIHACETRFTRFSDTSELADVNRSAGRWIHISQEMFDLLSQASGLANQTHGLFDPAILPELIREGYDRSIEMIRNIKNTQALPASNHRTRIPSEPQIHHFHFDQMELRDRAVLLPPGMKIDLGGIAKGWIAEQAAYRLAAFSDGVAVDIGGDIFFLGEPDNGPMWQVAIEDPLDPAFDLAVLHLMGPIAVATSSIVKRQWIQSKVTHHHIIDPRNGQSADTDWLCTTAITPHGAQSEAFAKALLIAGSRKADEISNNVLDLSFIAVDQNRSLWGSDKSKRLL